MLTHKAPHLRGFFMPAAAPLGSRQHRQRIVSEGRHSPHQGRDVPAAVATLARPFRGTQGGVHPIHHPERGPPVRCYGTPRGRQQERQPFVSALTAELPLMALTGSMTSADTTSACTCGKSGPPLMRRLPRHPAHRPPPPSCA